jgi:hypothetical protein
MRECKVKQRDISDLGGGGGAEQRKAPMCSYWECPMFQEKKK